MDDSILSPIERDTNNIYPRVIGGTKAPIGAYPWFARSTIYNDRDKWAGCSGSLVSPSFVLTAAHCIYGYDDFLNTGGYVIGSRCYGNGDPDNNNCGQSPSEYRELDAIWVDPEYNEYFGFDFDYALVRLKQPVVNIDPIIMNEESDIPEIDQDVIAMGFGATTNKGDGNASKNLLYVTLDILSKDFCEQKWFVEHTKQMVCAGGRRNKDSCTGDSGGPLITKTDTTDPGKLIGVSSFGGQKCADLDFPGVNLNLNQHFVSLVSSFSHLTFFSISIF